MLRSLHYLHYYLHSLLSLHSIRRKDLFLFQSLIQKPVAVLLASKQLFRMLVMTQKIFSNLIPNNSHSSCPVCTYCFVHAVLSDAIGKVCENEEFVAAAEEAGVTVDFMGIDEFAGYYEENHNSIREMIDSADFE